MQPKQEDDASAVVFVEYQPLPPQYRPYSPSEKEKRLLRRIERKKR